MAFPFGQTALRPAACRLPLAACRLPLAADDLALERHLRHMRKNFTMPCMRLRRSRNPADRFPMK
ncbi:hypothetical protein CQ393_17935 [Stenotrophomonas sp. MYb238]|nr:hypothetical protein [Stenotrophomonas sp. MYb238]